MDAGPLFRTRPLQAAMIALLVLLTLACIAVWWLVARTPPKMLNVHLLILPWSPFFDRPRGWDAWVGVAYALFHLSVLLSLVTAAWVVLRARALNGAFEFAFAMAAGALAGAIVLFLLPFVDPPQPFRWGRSMAWDDRADAALLALRAMASALAAGSIAALGRFFAGSPRALTPAELGGSAFSARTSALELRLWRWLIEAPLHRPLTLFLGLAIVGQLASDLVVYSLMTSEFSLTTLTMLLLIALGAISMLAPPILVWQALVRQYQLADGAARHALQSSFAAAVVAAALLVVPSLMAALVRFTDHAGAQVFLERLHDVVGYPAFLLAMTVAVALMVFRGGSFDARLVLSRAVTTSALSLVLTVLFVAVELPLQDMVLERLQVPGQTGTVIAGVTVALLFNPVRRMIESRVARLIDP